MDKRGPTGLPFALDGWRHDHRESWRFRRHVTVMGAAPLGNAPVRAAGSLGARERTAQVVSQALRFAQPRQISGVGVDGFARVAVRERCQYCVARQQVVHVRTKAPVVQ